jgi:alpha-tubulin suppressor-like RCC1 family protein
MKRLTVLLLPLALAVLAGCQDRDLPSGVAPSGPEFILVSSPLPFTQVSGGGSHSCALRNYGAVECWGHDDIYGSAPATKTAASGSFTQVSGGSGHTCALRSDGVVECWGAGATDTGLNPIYGQAPATKRAASGSFTQVSAGGFHTCALRSDGEVECWGYNIHQQAPATKRAANGLTYTQVTAGQAHSCALRSDSVVECWGFYGDEQKTATNNGSFTQVSAGSGHTCALRNDGVVECWGNDASGQAPATRSATPSMTRIDPTASFSATPTSVVAGNTFTLSLTGAQVPGYTGTVTFSYAFDCGDGSGYGLFGASHTASCPTSAAGTRTVKGTVRDQDNDQTEYTTTVEVTVPPDNTPPVITPSITGTLGTNGWYTSNVTVSWTVVDDESSVSSQTGCEETTISADTNGQTLTCTATSAGGTDSRSVTIRRDATPPGINLASRLPAANSNGWNNANVTVTWSCTDATSGVVSTSVSQPVSSEGQNQSAPGTCTDQAGNTAQATEAGISIDKTPPSLSPSVSPDPVVLNGSATASAGASDHLSGLASQSCEAVNTSTVSSKTVTCTATDNAGNSNSASATYSVAYAFNGFFAPVENLPVVNVAQAGSAIPVKFSLGGDQGLNIFASGSPTAPAVPCNAVDPTDNLTEVVNAGNSSLSYDAVADRYIYVWKTNKAWANTCRTLTLTFVDGTTQTASFKFTK